MTEYQPTPQTPDQVDEGLRNAMKQAKEDGVFDLDKLLEKHFKRPSLLWNVMRFQLGYSIDMCDEIVNAVEEWLPKEHDTNSYKWNQCVTMIRENLR
jgi:hypothetical protein